MVPRRLVLFTKPAVPGRVKTRLAGALTPERAAELHRAFLADVSERLLAAQARGELELWSAWALAPGEAVPAGPGRAFRQQGADLGARLAHGLGRAAHEEGGAAAVAALGSDHPTVPSARLAEAFRRVEAGADVVLGPSRDGGYYLVALAAGALSPELFEGVPWSTSDVLACTEERAARLGLAVERIEEGYDVDTPADLEHLAAELAADLAPDQVEAAGALAALCPRTVALLAAWGRLAAPVAAAREATS
jgi:hypothetical protein